MIVFLVKKNVLLYLTDYLHHIQRYLDKRFDLSTEILTYQPGVIPPKVKNYPIVIFVQWIDPVIFNHLSGATVAKPIPQQTNVRHPRTTFQSHRRLLQGPAVRPPRPTLNSHAEKLAVSQEPRNKIFLLNTEQATMTKYVRQTIADIKRYNVSVIDYSIENITLLKRKLLTTKFIHLPFPICIQPAAPKNTAVISLISSPHRKSVCDSVGVPVANFNGKWGDARDQLIGDSKILINVHYKPVEYGIFESIRCYHALEMRTLVISEPSVNQNNVLLKDYIIFSTAKQMRATLQDVLENYQKYYEQCFSEERIQELEERIERTYRDSIDKIVNSL